jgi:hypothetical protein
MGFFIFGLGIIIASQNLQIDMTQRVLRGWAFFCVGFKSQVGPKHGHGLFPGVLIDKMYPPMHGLDILSLGFERQDVPKRGLGLVSHGSVRQDGPKPPHFLEGHVTLADLRISYL